MNCQNGLPFERLGMAVGFRGSKPSGARRDDTTYVAGVVRSFIRTVGGQTFRAVMVHRDRWLISRRCLAKKRSGGNWQDIAELPSAEAAEDFISRQAPGADSF